MDFMWTLDSFFFLLLFSLMGAFTLRSIELLGLSKGWDRFFVFATVWDTFLLKLLEPKALSSSSSLFSSSNCLIYISLWIVTDLASFSLAKPSLRLVTKALIFFCLLRSKELVPLSFLEGLDVVTSTCLLSDLSEEIRAYFLICNS